MGDGGRGGRCGSHGRVLDSASQRPNSGGRTITDRARLLARRGRVGFRCNSRRGRGTDRSGGFRSYRNLRRPSAADSVLGKSRPVAVHGFLGNGNARTSSDGRSCSSSTGRARFLDEPVLAGLRRPRCGDGYPERPSRGPCDQGPQEPTPSAQVGTSLATAHSGRVLRGAGWGRQLSARASRLSLTNRRCRRLRR